MRKQIIIQKLSKSKIEQRSNEIMISINNSKRELELIKKEIQECNNVLSQNKNKLSIAQKDTIQGEEKLQKIEDKILEQKEELLLLILQADELTKKIDSKINENNNFNNKIKQKKLEISKLKDLLVKRKQEIVDELNDVNIVIQKNIKIVKQNIDDEIVIIKKKKEQKIKQINQDNEINKQNIQQKIEKLELNIQTKSDELNNLKSNIILKEKEKKNIQIITQNNEQTYKISRQKLESIQQNIVNQNEIEQKNKDKINKQDNEINKLKQLVKNNQIQYQESKSKVDEIEEELNNWKEYKISLIQKGDLYNRLLKQAKDVFITANISFPVDLIPLSIPKYG